MNVKPVHTAPLQIAGNRAKQMTKTSSQNLKRANSQIIMINKFELISKLKPTETPPNTLAIKFKYKKNKSVKTIIR